MRTASSSPSKGMNDSTGSNISSVRPACRCGRRRGSSAARTSPWGGARAAPPAAARALSASAEAMRTLDPVALALGHERPHDRPGVERVAVGDGRRRGRRGVDGLGVAFPGHEDPGVGAAHLAGQVHAAAHQARYGGVEIGVVAHDGGRLAAELQRQPRGCARRTGP